MYLTLRDHFCISGSSSPWHSRPVTLIHIRSLPGVTSEICLVEKSHPLWQPFKELVIGQVLINCIGLIVPITVDFQTTFRSVRTTNVLHPQRCTQRKWQQQWSKVTPSHARSTFRHQPGPTHLPWCWLDSWTATSSIDAEPWMASFLLCGGPRPVPRPCQGASHSLLRAYRCACEWRVLTYHRGRLWAGGWEPVWNSSSFRPLQVLWRDTAALHVPLKLPEASPSTQPSVHHESGQLGSTPPSMCSPSFLTSLPSSHSCFLGIHCSMKCSPRSFILGSVF